LNLLLGDDLIIPDNMNDYLWRCILLLIPSFIAMIFGIVKVFPKTKGLYFRMGTMGMACLFAGYLSSFATYLTGVSFDQTVNVSVLGNIGFSLFLMTQNADSVSSVMYKPGKQKGKNTALAWVAPILVVVIFLVAEVKMYGTTYEHGFSYWFRNIGLIGLSAALNAVTAFYTSRYSLAPDEEFGMVNCLRPYNIALTVLLVLLIPERFIRDAMVSTAGESVAIVAYYILLAVGILAVIPLMERGRVKFLTSL